MTRSAVDESVRVQLKAQLALPREQVADGPLGGHRVVSKGSKNECSAEERELHLIVGEAKFHGFSFFEALLRRGCFVLVSFRFLVRF